MLAVSSTPLGGGTLTVCLLAHAVTGKSITSTTIAPSGSSLKRHRFAEELMSDMDVSFRNNLFDGSASIGNSACSPLGVLRPVVVGTALRGGERTYRGILLLFDCAGSDK
jgi:hypothetical protein